MIGHRSEDYASIAAWLVAYLSRLLHVAPEAISVHRPFNSFGIDSSQAVTFAADLEKWLNTRLPATLAWDYPTIDSLSKHLSTTDFPLAELLTEIEQSTEEDGLMPIAIIGVGCRFPGASGPDAFWQLLRDGVDAIKEVPKDRWDVNAYYDPDPSKPGKMNTKWGGFLDRVDRFDANFFGVSPREAARIDPQQRIMLEVAWEALEDAGQVVDHLAGTATGVFVGIATNDYSHFQLKNTAQIDGYVGTGISPSIAANRISYLFDFRGPSIALDTSCASSLVAVHLACQSLRNRESTLALAGGVNAILSPSLAINFTKAGASAPDGRCKTFDSRANGYVRGEGAGMVVLKPLSRALADGDPIHAVIIGSAVNQDGRTNGLMAPNRYSQEAVLREAYARARISPRQVQYVEVHGTGTLLGDPIEAAALGAVVGKDRPLGEPCVLSCVKTNIGHLEAAAGVAGLIKVVLSVQHRQIPPTVHFREPNPHIPFDSLQLKVQQTLGPWISDGPALAGVSSFGFGGTNAHVVVREAPAVPVASFDASQRDFLFPLSARTAEALRDLARSYCDFFTSATDPSMGDIAYTLGVRRTHHDHRFSFVARSKEEAIDALDLFLAGAAGNAGRKGKLVFVFPGQGSQWIGMGRELFEHEPVFRASLERCDEMLRSLADWSLIDRLMKDDSQAQEIDVIQPVLFAVEVALAELWRSWGIQPDAVVGHSMGEIAAAHFAGILTLYDALRIVWYRSLLLKRVTGMGAMAAVELSLERATRVVADYPDRLSIAVSNSPTSTVLSGDPRAIDEVMDRLQREQIFCRLIKADVAAHSPQLDSMREEMLRGLDRIQPEREVIPFVSTVRTGPIAAFDQNYWWENMRGTVRFAAAMDRLIESGHLQFLEISPHPILIPAISDSLRMKKTDGLVLPSLRRGVGERAMLLASAGALYTVGRQLEWSRFYPKSGRCVRLPSYPWQRERFWFEDAPERKERVAEGHPLLGRRINLAPSSKDRVWECSFSTQRAPFVLDHCVSETVILPGAAYVEMALAAASELFGEGAWILTDVRFHKGFFLAEGLRRSVQTIFSSNGAGEATFEIHSRDGRSESDDDPWILHASGRIARDTDDVQHDHESVADVRCRLVAETTGQTFYSELSALGNQYGPCHQGVRHVWHGAGEALVEFQVPEEISPDVARYQLHPAILDALWQALAAALLYSSEGNVSGPSVPVHIDRLRIRRSPLAKAWSHARIATSDVCVFDETGELIVETSGLRIHALDGAEHVRNNDYAGWLYSLKWLAKPHKTRQNADSRTAAAAPWVILCDSGGVGQRLAGILEGRGETCVLIHPGASEDFDGLTTCRGVVHLWSLDRGGGALLDQVQSNLMSAVNLVQGFAKRQSNVPLWFVTRGAQSIEASAAPELAQSPLWGLARVLSQEHPSLWGGVIDVDPAATVAGAAAAIFSEIDNPDGEDQIAFRRGTRFVARLERDQPASDCVRFQWRPDASYIVTGGLGELGLELARWMVEQGARHLILLSRRSPQDREMRAIRELESRGSTVRIASVDVADEEQLTAFLGKYRLECPWPIRGVFHAAGMVEMKPLIEIDAVSLLSILRPKVAGAWLLHCLLKDDPLDFFVLFSSFSSLVSSPQLGSYTAANVFMDALAHHRHAQNLPALAINWGFWSNVGMASRYLQDGRALLRGVGTFTPAQGLDVLGQLLDYHFPQIGVMRLDWKIWAKMYPTYSKSPLLSEIFTSAIVEVPQQPAESTSDIRELILSAEPDARRQIVATYLHQQVARTLRIAPAKLDVERSLTAMGLDSLMAVELRNRIQNDLGVTVPIVALLKGPSVTQLSMDLIEWVTASESDWEILKI